MVANATPMRRERHADRVAIRLRPPTVHRHMSASPSSSPRRLPTIGIVIPTLNECALLPGLLDHLVRLSGWNEVLISDGGSRDGTLACAQNHPLAPRVLATNGGRAAQLNHAFAAIRSDAILVLGADLRPHATALPCIHRALAAGVVAGCLRLHHSQRSLWFRWQDAWSRLRATWTAGAYLDQAPFFVRSVALAAGGFRAVGGYDTADLGRRLAKPGTFRPLSAPVVASCRHWQHHGFVRGTLIHQRHRLRHFLSIA